MQVDDALGLGGERRRLRRERVGAAGRRRRVGAASRSLPISDASAMAPSAAVAAPEEVPAGDELGVFAGARFIAVHATQPFVSTPSRFSSTFATTVHAASSAASAPGGQRPERVGRHRLGGVGVARGSASSSRVVQLDDVLHLLRRRRAGQAELQRRTRPGPPASRRLPRRSAAPAPARPRRRPGRSASRTPGAACSCGSGGPCTSRGSARRTSPSTGTASSAARTCTARGGSGPRRCWSGRSARR